MEKIKMFEVKLTDSQTKLLLECVNYLGCCLASFVVRDNTCKSVRKYQRKVARLSRLFSILENSFFVADLKESSSSIKDSDIYKKL